MKNGEKFAYHPPPPLNNTEVGKHATLLHKLLDQQHMHPLHPTLRLMGGVGGGWLGGDMACLI